MPNESSPIEARAERVSAADGYALGTRRYEAADASGPVLVVASATAVRQEFYARFARWMAGEGVTVVTFDYRGIGASAPHRLRGFQASMADWGQHDLEGVLRDVLRRDAGRPLAILGHSVGGQLLGLAASARQARAVVTIASQSGYVGLWPAHTRPLMAAVMYGVIPLSVGTMGYVPGQLGLKEHLPGGVAAEWARWCRSPGYLTDHLDARQGFEKLELPVQAWSFSDDIYGPRRAVDWLHGLMSRARVDRRHIKPARWGVKAVGHFGFFRPSVGQAEGWGEVQRFVTGATALRAQVA